MIGGHVITWLVFQDFKSKDSMILTCLSDCKMQKKGNCSSGVVAFFEVADVANKNGTFLDGPEW